MLKNGEALFSVLGRALQLIPEPIEIFLLVFTLLI